MAEWCIYYKRIYFLTQRSTTYYVDIFLPPVNCDPSSHGKWNPAISRSYCSIQNLIWDAFILVPRFWSTNERWIFYTRDTGQQAVLRNRIQIQYFPISKVLDGFSMFDCTTLTPRSFCALHMPSWHKISYEDSENMG